MNDYLIKYPLDWLCRNCNRTFEKHLPYKNWCYGPREFSAEQHAYQWFKPMDNLTLIERIAEKRDLI